MVALSFALISCFTSLIYATINQFTSNEYVFNTNKELDSALDYYVAQYDFSGKLVPIRDKNVSITLKNITLSDSITYQELENWIEKTADISFERLLRNINDKGLWHDSNDIFKSNITLPEGIVVASSSKYKPNYFYQWTRDSALVFNSVLKQTFNFDPPSFNRTLFNTIMKYINNTYFLQRIDNRSGMFNDPLLKGLGEPKFEVDNTAFNDNWGRPQNDGPALRSIIILKFLVTAHSIFPKGKLPHELFQPFFENESEIFNNVIKYDLEFTLKNWKEPGFDLWEEVYGSHFFTTLTQLKSIQIALKYLKYANLQDIDAARWEGRLKTTYYEILEYLMLDSDYIIQGKTFIIESPNEYKKGKRSGLDIAVILATIFAHDTFDDMFKTDNFPFDVTDSMILNTFSQIVDSMKLIYPINKRYFDSNTGVALGRYPEDIYDGIDVSVGNPWFLATLSASELLYKVLKKYTIDKNDLIIPMNSDMNIFWQTFFENLNPQLKSQKQDNDHISFTNEFLVLPYGSKSYKKSIKSIQLYADSFLERVFTHQGEDYQMSEQYNRYTGFLTGASNLTWSYEALCSAIWARNNFLKLLPEGYSI